MSPSNQMAGGFEVRRPKGKAGKVASRSSTFGGIVVPRVIGEVPIFVHQFGKNHIRRNAERRRARPTRAEAELQRILNSLNGGILKGRFTREHVVSGKWIVDFFFYEIRLAIEVDGSVHDTPAQQEADRQKDTDCKRFDITVLRLRNADIFGDRDRLVEKLRAGWRAARKRENRIIGSSR